MSITWKYEELQSVAVSLVLKQPCFLHGSVWFGVHARLHGLMQLCCSLPRQGVLKCVTY